MVGEGKGHRKPTAGPKAAKRKAAEQKKKGVLDEAKAAKGANNPKAFSFQSAGKAKAQRARSAEKEQRRMHAPMMDKVVDEPPPLVVLVQGPPGVGKSTLIKCLVKHYTQQNLAEVLGPITVVAGKKRRITFVECPPDLNGMLDAAKYADLVLLLIDASFGFEMETFEFLNLLQVHGFPKVMGVLTHLDSFTEQSRLKKTKKKLKARFWTEIYDGAKLFYLSGIQYGKYHKRDVFNLARFISCVKMRPLTWRLGHPYALVDRFEDITPRETVRQRPKCDRDVTIYGYLRGTNLKPGARIHLAGVGDYTIQELDPLPDPCPLPESSKKRGLNEKDRLLYAPMANVGGLLYDKDAVYIDIPDWKVQYTGEGISEGTEGDAMVRQLQKSTEAVDEKLERSQLRLFSGAAPMNADDAGFDSDEEGGSEGGSEDEGEDDEEEEEEMDGDDGSDDEGDDAMEDDEGGSPLPNGMPKSLTVSSGGRARRRAVFGSDAVAVEPHSDEEDEDEEGGEQGEDGFVNGAAGGSDEDEAEEEEEEEEEGLGGAAHWKSDMAARAAAVFAAKATDLFTFVYGRAPSANGTGGDAEGGRGESGDDEEGDDDDDLFKPVKRKTELQAANDLEAVDALDSARVAISSALLSAWEGEDAIESLRNRFVTGDWQEGQRRSQAVPGTGSDNEEVGEGEEVFDDFQDMETGEVITGAAAAAVAARSGKGDAVLDAAQKAIKDAEREEMRLKKAAQKAAFDASYDQGGLKGAKGGKGKGDTAGADEDDEQGGEAKVAIKGQKAGGEKEETYYDAVKKELAERQARTKAMLDSVDPVTRMAMEGLRPGTYVRMRLSGIPCELVNFLDPRTPLLVGGLGQGEEKMGVMKLRFKRHRWFPKVLKARDPLMFSVGWRRFQSIPVYAIEDHNRRLRNLKYTPEHMHCVAAVYGPLAPPNTGVVAIQNLSDSVRGWRISATGVVLELDAQFRVMKKLKLVGTPFKVHRNTAFVSGMFTSQLEATKFEGASIRTVSGIRGTIKKAVKPGGVQGVKEGCFRAGFEDKILSSDIVFLRAWVAVDIPHFFNPVTNLLSKQPVKVEGESRGKGGKKQARRNTAAELAAGAAAIVASPAAGASVQQAQDPADLLALPMGAAAAQPASASGLMEFQPSPRFTGARPGFIFKLGSQGQGYYKDYGPHAAASRAVAEASAAKLQARTGADAAGASAANGGEGGAGWVTMRTVAQLRRELGEGAPRNNDSLYRPIERAPRKFNPLRIPLALQAALPFKTKPKLEPKRKIKTLEQKRAVVLEPHEKRAYTLIQQLNAIRNQKGKKREESNARRKEQRGKKLAVEEQWRAKVNKEERKKRYVEQGNAEKRKALLAEGGGKGGRSKKRAKRE